MFSAPARRCDRMMMLMPARTADSARAQSVSSASFNPLAPCSAGQVVSSVRDLKWTSPTSEMARIFSRSPLVRIGCRTSRRLRCEAPSRSNRFGRGPMIDTRLMTSSSRIGSIGGLVTCAKFCLKYVKRSFGLSESAEIRLSFPRAPAPPLPRPRHRRHRDAQFFLGVSEGLLSIEQRQVRQRCVLGRGRQLFQHDLRALEPLLVGMALCQGRLELVVWNEPAL